MSNLLLNLIYSLTAGFTSVTSHIGSFMSGIFFFDYLGAIFSNGASAVSGGIIQVLWTIEKFVLGIMEMFEYIVDSFLGIGSSINDYQIFADQNNLTETFVKTFKAIVAVAIVLMIIFTIYAIIK